MIRMVCVLICGLLLYPSAASAHVKWFSDFSFQDKPLTLTETLDPLFWGLVVLSMVAIALLVFVDKKLSGMPRIQKLTEHLSGYRKYSLTLMRGASAAVLLLSFQADALFVPELAIPSAAIGWIQFILAVFLLFSRMVPVSGLGMMALYAFGMHHFGWFHMLDYTLFAGVGYYLTVSLASSGKIKESGLVALYATTGFSLCWVAMEKLLYPQWGLYILNQNPQLAMGLDSRFFLTAAAFVEFSLGYLMIICLLQRPLAIVVTLVFFTTTLVFGKMEVIGHTIIHAALLVFIIEGSGRFYKAPIHFHDRFRLKVPFAMLNFVLLLFLMLIPYQRIAMSNHEAFLHVRDTVASVDATDWANPPKIEIELIEDDMMGWNMRIKTENFTFAPERSGQAHVKGEGHAHVYVNDKKMGRIYGEWFYLSDLPPGKHMVRVTLNTNDHRMYLFNNESIEDTVELEVKADQMKQEHR